MTIEQMLEREVRRIGATALEKQIASELNEVNIDGGILCNYMRYQNPARWEPPKTLLTQPIIFDPPSGDIIEIGEEISHTYMALDFHPNGREIILLRQEVNHEKNQVDSSTLIRFTDKGPEVVREFKETMIPMGSFQYSPDGDHFCLHALKHDRTRGTYDNELVVGSFDKGSASFWKDLDLEPHGARIFPIYFGDFDWSPSGDRVVATYGKRLFILEKDSYRRHELEFPDNIAGIGSVRFKDEETISYFASYFGRKFQSDKGAEYEYSISKKRTKRTSGWRNKRHVRFTSRSPDGKEKVLVNQKGIYGEIYQLGIWKRMIDTIGSFPIWSPDSSKIFYESWDRESFNRKICIYNLKTSEKSEFSTDTDIMPVRWR